MKRKLKRSRAIKKKSHFEIPGVAKITGILILLGLIASGYLGFDSWKEAYHASFAIAGDVKKQFQSIAQILQKQQEYNIESQISDRRVERRVLLRQVGDINLRAKKASDGDREALQPVINDLNRQIIDIDGEIRRLGEKLKK